MNTLIDMNDPRLLEDSRFRAMWEADRVWKSSFMLNSTERILYLRDLHRHEMFSLSQLAKICRVSSSTVSRKFPKNAPGGRFDPQTLKPLMMLRRAVLSGEQLQRYLISQVVDSGTSVGTIARLTGASATNLYKILSS